MNFDFSEDQRELQRSVRDTLQKESPLETARKVLEAGSGYSESLWKAAGELGWLGAAVPEELGGAGLGHLELALIAEELGRALAPIPVSSSVYLAIEALNLAGSDSQKARYLPKLASGELVGTCAWIEGAGLSTEATLRTSYADGKLRGSKGPVADGMIADVAIVAARDGEGVTLAVVDLTGDGVERGALESIDPSRPQAKLRFSGAKADVLGERERGWDLLQRVLDRAAVLMAFEQLGGAERAFEMTREYCLNRYAFGRPVASFQALKHRMADLFVDIELARSNAYYGAWALSTGSNDLPTAACAARASASDAFDLSATEMIQMHGGVGYTWEYDCHLFYRRAKLLGLALGSATEWRARLMDRLDRASRDRGRRGTRPDQPAKA